ncbi:BON domain-containing protein [Leptolyngbya sp. FACHB-36]|uniref:BON domain-containing protein n=1 Tax=Leptolyngbya sp. FACHB-36 TaxID=2692808 RepID=UPI001681A26E|nr:BON domain-containing protein [Leptolyngbya sp. FACHB-36]MBD2018931.1 BON domain-containing protein [Leptolyngbya sp. FACHB-36]
MNRISLLFLSGALLLGTVACNDAARTSSSTPNTTSEAANQGMDKSTAQTNQNDATSEVRRRQLNSDIRSREERNNALNEGKQENRSDADLKSEVRSKLEANFPASQLAVDAEDGVVKVSGTVVNEQQLSKIEPIAKDIGGVKQVIVEAKVEKAAKPDPAKPGSSVPLQQQTGK